MIFCTQLTYDLFLRLRSNYRPGIHPYVFCHISRNNISMGRIMYSILPSKVKISVFFPMGLPTSCYILNTLAKILSQRLCWEEAIDTVKNSIDYWSMKLMLIIVNYRIKKKSYAILFSFGNIFLYIQPTSCSYFLVLVM